MNLLRPVNQCLVHDHPVIDLKKIQVNALLLFTISTNRVQYPQKIHNVEKSMHAWMKAAIKIFLI